MTNDGITKEAYVRSLECFKQVADVLGEEAAEVELREAIEHLGHWPDVDLSLMAAFTWDETPQGINF